jgi:hypothetical protein
VGGFERGLQGGIGVEHAAEAQLGDYIDQFYGHELSVDGILTEIETGEIDYDSLQAGGDEYTQPMVRLVNAILVDAVKRGASDIHFEPEYAFLRIRYRIDGVLETVRSLHKTYMPGITVRLKVVKPCVRCSVPDVDPTTGVQGHAVGDALSAYRADARADGGITFGMYAVVIDGRNARLRTGLAGGATFGFD